MRAPADLNGPELEEAVQALGKQVTYLECQLGEMRAQLQAYSTELAKRRRPAPEPRLSDHALLRYLERVKGVDVDGAKREIMTPTVIAAIKAMATTVIVNGARLLVKDGTIVTIMEAEKKPKLKAYNRRGDELEAAE